jgi:hypothetical protein
LAAWVERRRIPPGLFYLGLGTILFAGEVTIQWLTGDVAVGVINTFQVWLAYEVGLLLWLMHYLDRAATRALEKLRPTLRVDEGTYQSLYYQLSTLPAQWTLLASIAGACYALLPFTIISSSVQDGIVPATQVIAQPWPLRVTVTLLILNWWCLGAFIFHTIHQLRLISRIYNEYVQLNLTNIGPLYAFSGVTARTSIALILLNYLWYASSPGLLTQPIIIVVGIVMALFAATTFILPLLGLHRRMAEEKERLLSENGQRIQDVVLELYRDMDARDLGRLSALKDALTALDLHRQRLERIPTWPWEPELFRLLLTTLLLPLAIYILQLVIQRLLAA